MNPKLKKQQEKFIKAVKHEMIDKDLNAERLRSLAKISVKTWYNYARMKTPISIYNLFAISDAVGLGVSFEFYNFES